MDLTIITVSWNVRDLLRGLLVSISKHTTDISCEVWVVDNASKDGSADMVRAEFPQVNLIVNSENRGFAAACNQAIRKSTGEVVLLLNPDAEIVDDSPVRLVQWMRDHAAVGIVGPRITQPDGTLQRTVRRFPTLASQLMVMLELHHLFPSCGTMARYLANDFDYTREQAVDQVIGAFFAVRRTLFGTIGMLDENFFIWYEEVDFCKRAVGAGNQVFYTPVLHAVHRGGQSFAQIDAVVKRRYMLASLHVYARKHWSRSAATLVLLITPISIVLAWLIKVTHIKPTAYRSV